VLKFFDAPPKSRINLRRRTAAAADRFLTPIFHFSAIQFLQMRICNPTIFFNFQRTVHYPEYIIFQRGLIRTKSQLQA
jgi:hypothetical protein